MRILLIHNFYQYWGGEDSYVTSLKELLEKKGHKVYLYSKDSKEIKTIWDKIRAAIGFFYNPWVEKELTKIIKEFKPDIAHFHNIYPLIGPTAYRVCKKFKIPIIQTAHNYRFMCPKGILFRRGKICEFCVKKKFTYPSILYGCYHQSRFASAVFSCSFLFHQLIKSFDLIGAFIFPSEFTRKYYVKNLNLPLSKSYVIPYFVNIDRKSISKGKKGDYFLFVGRLSEEKGIIQLLNVFVTLPQLKLIVIGDGPLRKEVLKNKRYNNIIIKDFLSKKEIYNYMAKALATIIPSLWYETGPLVMIESFAFGTPVIVPELGVFKHVVIEKKTGIFYRCDDYKNLKSKLTNFSQHRQLTKNINKQTRREYEIKYTSNYHYNSLIRIYKSLRT